MHTQNPYSAPSNAYSKSILGTIECILKIHTLHHRMHTQNPYSAPSNAYSKSILGTIECILKIHTRHHRILTGTTTFSHTHIIPTPPNAQHSPRTQAHGQAPEGYIQRHTFRHRLDA